MRYFIHEKRTERHITLGMLAIKTGISKSYLSEIENGKANPRVSVLEKIALSLGCDIGDLISVR